MEFPENIPRDYTDSTSFPDLMNDPLYATNTEGKDRGFEDPDTCRICRGEGSEEEQLFYPCKCSGSIKFVHQACLVEWLSHSQKKYCELCKTPFRFTKLYDPNMPRDLPAPLFMKQLVVHSVRTIITWLRFVLVAFVWLGWLPWSMRAIWRALFWLADGRWSGGDNSQQGTAQERLAKLLANSTTLINDVTTTTSAEISAATESTVTSIPSPGSSVSSIFGFSANEPMMLTVLKKALSTLFFPAISSTNGAVNSSNTTTGSLKQRYPSWLSDVKFLNSLTPSPTINNILIDTLEGQLITLLVVISFILVFLIREWVVQQQPMANIADGEREAAVQLIANNRPNQEEPEAQPPVQLQDDDHTDDEHLEQLSDHDEEDPLPSPPFHFDTNGRASFLEDDDSFGFGGMPSEGPSASSASRRDMDFDYASTIDGSTGPSSAHTNPAQPGWERIRDLWTRGNGDPEQVLRIIREEGRQEELAWLAGVMSRRVHNSETPLNSSDSTAFMDLNQSGENNPEQPPLSNFQHSSGSTANVTASPTWNTGDLRDLRDLHAQGEQGSSSQPFAFNFLESEPENMETNEATPNPQDHPSEPSNNEHGNVDQVNMSAETSNESRAPVTNAETSEHTPVPPQAEPHSGPPKSLTDRVFDWFWADITLDDQTQDPPQQDDEHIVEDPALEAPFIPVQNNRRFANAGAQEDQDVAPLAAEAGIDANDIDAVEEGDDLEGILELIGMQGPIFGLLQNGVFSALLISFTVALGIWLPYLWGKIALVLLANPIQLVFGVPMTAVSVIADVTLDTLIGSLGYVMYWVSLICKLVLSPVSAFVPLGDWIPQTKSVTSASLSLIDASSHRLKKVANAFFIFHESDVPMFSVLSHQALKIHQARISGLFKSVFIVIKFVLHDFPLRIVTLGVPGALSFDYHAADLKNVLIQGRDQIYSLINHPLISMNSKKWVNAGAAKAANMPVDYDLAVWDTKDRIIAITMGYLLASMLGLLYLRITGLLSGMNRGQRIEGLVADILHQAGGVMKVILIIGIEMIVFPLYCGSLLDIALLPLFDQATIASRISFTSSSPLTSLFVHWFIGTCYMFHFALFVSMCRKIMRSGVLYFIRDPDDPTFHPVRDVLERNITTQLRKIAFSALVYGTLVIVCLGGVVWGLYYAFDGVLPIHWSATIPVLEFPVDLLFYNFVMPLAIRSIKPSDQLHVLYNWWFQKCARFLRLTNFFFGERRLDEEGHHVRRTWWSVLSAKKGDSEHPVIGPAQQSQVDQKNLDTYFLRDGRYVRAPASDQVRIPKGRQVFLEVTEANDRVDGAPDPDDGLHGRDSDMFTKVYIPPSFRTRIAAFILLIWLFAAATGVGITIIPLVIGRALMSSYFPNRSPLNDIYAFSTGMCITVGVAYSIYYCKTRLGAVQDHLSSYLRSPRQACVGLAQIGLDALRLAYIFVAFSVFLPSLFALTMELYVLVPVHTYLGGPQAHVIHFVQDWTLGVLYVQMAIKFVLWNSTSRPAAALNSVFRDGWLKPNASLATRALVLPITLLVTVAVIVPLSFGFVLNSTVFHATPGVQSEVYRYAYPATLTMSLVLIIARLVRRQLEIWRVHVRDDVYLIGERLHNFSEKRAKDVGAARRVITG
ncbi:hypothetical protein ASPWEDRAFT_118916 [Aspergillus wentii DTO 134E9]|uniref:RING-type E3 ubiquitin transferase n=1 Tax=Aspergillus wentii DTO 134E9 TaxID=1073089 RepID=A0A1L9R7X8_ASPWE|nr:uncharacterized protein ASPWEDRAFT_118916 [Aspergillus wentii DTO 134E9]OJJ31026.1 hypothetical protein ASPWEDRAFT_118916 [Aspergillus wentii DTO 134E9]